MRRSQVFAQIDVTHLSQWLPVNPGLCFAYTPGTFEEISASGTEVSELPSRKVCRLHEHYLKAANDDSELGH